jgi:hypothetical protein
MKRERKVKRRKRKRRRSRTENLRRKNLMNLLISKTSHRKLDIS